METMNGKTEEIKNGTHPVSLMFEPVELKSQDGVQQVQT